MSLLFNADTDRVKLGADEPIGTDRIPFSVWGWIYPTSNPTSGQRKEIICRNTTSASFWWRLAFAFDQAVVMRIEYSGGTAFAKAADNTTALNIWQFVCGTVTSSVVNIYYGRTIKEIAEVTSTSNAPSGSHTNATPDINIGAGDDDSQGFPGRLANVGMVQGKALTLEEIKSVAAANRDLPTLQGLVGYWPMHRPRGVVLDQTGNSNHGVVVGATWAPHPPEPKDLAALTYGFRFLEITAEEEELLNIARQLNFHDSDANVGYVYGSLLPIRKRFAIIGEPWREGGSLVG